MKKRLLIKKIKFSSNSLTVTVYQYLVLASKNSYRDTFSFNDALISVKNTTLPHINHSIQVIVLQFEQNLFVSLFDIKMFYVDLICFFVVVFF